MVAAAVERGLTLSVAHRVQYATGKGVRGTVDGKRVAVGNAALMKEAGVQISTNPEMPGTTLSRVA